MTETYFSKFNQIQYANTTVIDITERVVSLNNFLINPYVFYPLDITTGSRADQIASYNFKDPYTSWVLYLTNGIIDPYYDWYLDTNQFNSFIISKYGSIQQATQKVVYWTNNWSNQEHLDPNGYQAEVLGNPDRVKYWQVHDYNYYGQPISYSRVPIDWKIDTNQLVSYSVNNSNNFIIGEIVSIANNTTKGKAQVVNAVDNTIIVNQVFTYVSSGTITGEESNQTTNITSVNYQKVNISNNEIAYWTPVYYYDMEKIKNEGNRIIRVMDNNYVPQFIYNVKQLLSEK